MSDKKKDEKKKKSLLDRMREWANPPGKYDGNPEDPKDKNKTYQGKFADGGIAKDKVKKARRDALAKIAKAASK